MALIDISTAVHDYGYAAVGLIVGLESVGIPLPGETALILAAYFAAGAPGGVHLSIGWVLAAAIAGAVIGDNLGYLLGRRWGFWLLRRYGKRLRIDESKLKIGRYLFARHGGKVVFFGRFVAVLRTYAAFLAGTNAMSWRRFLFFNATGGVLWACAWGGASYGFHSVLDRYQGTANTVLIVAGVIAVVAGLWWLRRKEHELSLRAEAAYPGPLDDTVPGPRNGDPTTADPLG